MLEIAEGKTDHHGYQWAAVADCERLSPVKGIGPNPKSVITGTQQYTPQQATDHVCKAEISSITNLLELARMRFCAWAQGNVQAHD